jgi:hypothetical protein
LNHNAIDGEEKIDRSSDRKIVAKGSTGHFFYLRKRETIRDSFRIAMRFCDKAIIDFCVGEALKQGFFEVKAVAVPRLDDQALASAAFNPGV